jgi:methylmalonyl-CoA mutase cobalamin-binding subunit
MSKVNAVIRGAIVLTLFSVPLLPAQQPTSQQIQAVLQNPAMAALLCTRLATSGLTADQVRARLRSAGYADTLLNAYLPGATDTSAWETDNASSITNSTRGQNSSIPAV